MIAASVVALAIATAAPHVSAEARARYADDIAAASSDLETALALVTMARFESDFRHDVESCSVTGDGGRALGLYQLHGHWLGRHHAQAVCSSNRLSTQLAASAFTRLRGPNGVEEAFARYLGAKPTDRRVANRMKLYRQLVEVAGGDA